MEEAFVDMKLSAAREQIRMAQGQLDTAIEAGRASSSNVDGLDGAAGNLKEARRCMDDISAKIEADAAALPAMRDCPSCGKSIRAAATLCGFCWKKSVLAA